MSDSVAVGAIEMGGTKTRCAMMGASEQIESSVNLPTATPEQTLGEVAAFFAAHITRNPRLFLGIASFGPVSINRQADNFGELTGTPKPGWSGVNLVHRLSQTLAIEPSRIALHTDVVAAALAEAKQISATTSLAYFTVGTGVGMGWVLEGKVPPTALHPEAGHLFVPRHPDDTFAGVCPFHNDCLEGLASGPSMAARWGVDADLIVEEAAWQMQAWYLAHACLNAVRILGVNRLVLGGGVMQTEGLLARIHQQLSELGGDYYLPGAWESCVGLPMLGNDAGLIGAASLARSLSTT